ncbi:MAG TPA: carboxymuconolactone decarboxylase family protein [Planctomycetaceae bacterium]|nr:carboxymuconolactone decarboxylase family protein [Planctomycetaceae bacterium]
MTRIPPLTEADAADKVAQTLERVREMLEGEPIPAPFLTYARVPAFVQDFYMNYKKFVWTEGHLDVKAKGTISLAVSGMLRCNVWADYFVARLARLGLGEQYVADTLAVSAACQMYNAFFKFRDLAGSDVFGGMSVGLRAHTFANTSLDPKMVELVNIAISDLNGCKPCTSGHVDSARKLGLSDDAILECVQCAATMASGCGFLNAAGP